MSSDVNTLMEMGFPQNQAEKALYKTSYKGVQLAMDWLFSHADDPDINDPFTPPAPHILGTAADAQDKTSDAVISPPDGEPGAEADTAADGDASVAMETEPAAEAKSLKCDECGKLLRSAMDVEAHAARTQHSSFSESTEEIRPLTEEEKKDQLAKIQERIKQRREEKEHLEKQSQLQREKNRRVTGKEVGKSKQKIEEDEIRKLAEQRRKEKQEDKIARQRIKDEIEKDKRDRAARLAKSPDVTPKSAESPVPVTSPATSAPTVTSPITSAPKQYTDCRLQIRLTNGEALTQTFSAKEPLAAVRVYIQLNRTDGQGTFNLMTNFPKKVFTEDDMETPLQELGLVPSAVIMVTKVQ